MDPKYPDVLVQLSGEDGNAGAIMGRVTRAMSRAEVPSGDIQTFREECMSGDYDALLRTCMKWVNVV